VNVIRNANVTIVLRAHLCQKWIDLRQTKTKKITDPFYTNAKYISPVKMLPFCDI